MWVILPLQDWLSIDEKLRNPILPPSGSIYQQIRSTTGVTGCISPWNDLLKETAFNEKVAALSGT
jgi:4-alpha-glucanotransferase